MAGRDANKTQFGRESRNESAEMFVRCLCWCFIVMGLQCKFDRIPGSIENDPSGTHSNVPIEKAILMLKYVYQIDCCLHISTHTHNIPFPNTNKGEHKMDETSTRTCTCRIILCFCRAEESSYHFEDAKHSFTHALTTSNPFEIPVSILFYQFEQIRTACNWKKRKKYTEWWSHKQIIMERRRHLRSRYSIKDRAYCPILPTATDYTRPTGRQEKRWTTHESVLILSIFHWHQVPTIPNNYTIIFKMKITTCRRLSPTFHRLHLASDYVAIRSTHQQQQIDHNRSEGKHCWLVRAHFSAPCSGSTPKYLQLKWKTSLDAWREKCR